MRTLNTINAADYGLIALYLGTVIAVGLYAARKNRNTGDFFKAGGQMPWALAGISNWVSGFSAFMFVAAAGFTYHVGLGTVFIFTLDGWSYLVGFFYFAQLWRRARLDSPLQFLTRRYSRSTTYFYTVTSVLPQTVGIGMGIYILCIFVSTALGFGDHRCHVGGLELSGLQLSMIVIGLVMVFYTMIGGLWAAVLSDVVQSIIIMVMSVIIFPVSYYYLGGGHGFVAGFERMTREVPAGFLVAQGLTADPWFILATVISSLLGYNASWFLVQRYSCVPDERGARKMALLCAGLSVVGPLIWILPVLASKVIFPDLGTLWPSLKDPAEASYVSLALLLLPHGLIGFVVSAVLSAMLGQANATLNWLSATVTHDIFVPLHRRWAGTLPSDRRQMRVAQLAILVIGLSAIAVALYIPRFGSVYFFGLQYFSLMAAFMMPVALGLIYRRTPWWSGIASCSAALGSAGIMMALDVWPENTFARNMLTETVVATLVFFLSARWFKADDPRHAELARLEIDLNTPVPPAGGSPREALGAWGLIGVIAMILGGVLIACTALPSSAAAPSWLNAVAGGLLLMLGLGLRRLARPA